MLQRIITVLLAFTKIETELIDNTSLRRVRRVVGGDLVTVSEVPYLVNIRKRGIFECGGSLITPKCVLAAAHCVKEGVSNDFIVRGGVTFLNDHRNARQVENIFIHESYESKTLDYDLAIFKLQSPLAGDDIAIIEVGEEAPVTGDYVKVSGWGLISETAKKPSLHIRSAQLQVMQKEKCIALYKNYRNVTENMFCASIPGIKDACSADSGGPAVRNGKLVGVVSWGKGYECARVESPGVYVNVEHVRPWIETIMYKECQ